MNELALSLQATFENSTVFDCRLILDVYLPDENHRGESKRPDIDAIAFVNGLFATIELKDYSGYVTTFFERDKPWLIDGKLETFVLSDKKTGTYDQVMGERNALVRFLIDKILGEDRRKQPDFERNLRRGIISYVVLPDDSKIILPDDAKNKKNIVAIYLRQLPQMLRFIPRDAPILSESEFECFLDAIDAKASTLERWLEGGISDPKITIHNEDIPEVERLLSSDETENILKGLKLVRELKLGRYLVLVAKQVGHPDPRIRSESLAALFELDRRLWQSMIAGELYRKEGSLKAELLKQLCNLPSVTWSEELVDILKLLIGNGFSEHSLDAIKALARVSDTRVDTYFLGLLEEKIEEGFFTDIDRVLREIEVLRLDGGHAGKQEQEYLNRLAWLEQEKSRKLTFLKAIISVFEERKSDAASDILLNLMLHPQRLGLASCENACKKFANENFDFYNIFVEASRCLWSAGSKLPERDIVNAILESSDDYMPFLLYLVGEDASSSARDAIMPLLNSNDATVRVATMKALGRMRAEKAFDNVLKIFEGDEDGRATEMEAGIVLESLSPEKFEKYLCRRIDEMENKKDALMLFVYLRRVASTYSIDFLFKWTSDQFLYLNASDLLKWMANMQGRESILERANQMLDDPNPCIRASGLLILSDSLIHSAGGISEYENDTSLEVRSIIVELYRSLAEEEGLFRLLNSSKDTGERKEIFIGLLSINYDRFFEFSVSRGMGSVAEADALVCKKNLLLKIGEKVISIESGRIEKMGVLEYDDNPIGLYMRCEGQPAYLFVPVSRFSYSLESIYIGRFRSELFKITGITLEQEDVAAEIDAKKLWGDFIQKNRFPFHIQMNPEEVKYVNYVRV